MDKETEAHVRVVSNGNAMLPADENSLFSLNLERSGLELLSRRVATA